MSEENQKMSEYAIPVMILIFLIVVGTAGYWYGRNTQIEYDASLVVDFIEEDLSMSQADWYDKYSAYMGFATKCIEELNDTYTRYYPISRGVLYQEVLMMLRYSAGGMNNDVNITYREREIDLLIDELINLTITLQGLDEETRVYSPHNARAKELNDGLNFNITVVSE